MSNLDDDNVDDDDDDGTSDCCTNMSVASVTPCCS